MSPGFRVRVQRAVHNAGEIHHAQRAPRRVVPSTEARREGHAPDRGKHRSSRAISARSTVARRLQTEP